MADITHTIDPNDWYSLSDLVAMRILPFGREIRAVGRIVEADHAKRNILRPIIRGKGYGKRYSFKGANIIKFKELVEEGEYRL